MNKMKFYNKFKTFIMVHSLPEVTQTITHGEFTSQYDCVFLFHIEMMMRFEN